MFLRCGGLGVGGAWSPGSGLVWRQPGRGALGWCQAVPQARSPWRAPVAGALNRPRRRAVSHPTHEARSSLSFLRPLLGRSHPAPVVKVRPPRPGGLAVLQLGWGTPWCTGPVGRLASARVRDRCHRAPLAGVGCRSPWPCVRGELSPRQRAGRRPWHGGGGGAGRSVCCPAGVRVKRCLCSRFAGVGMVGMCARSVRGLLERRRGSVADDVLCALELLGPPWPLSISSGKTPLRAAVRAPRLLVPLRRAALHPCIGVRTASVCLGRTVGGGFCTC